MARRDCAFLSRREEIIAGLSTPGIACLHRMEIKSIDGVKQQPCALVIGRAQWLKWSETQMPGGEGGLLVWWHSTRRGEQLGRKLPVLAGIPDSRIPSTRRISKLI